MRKAEKPDNVCEMITKLVSDSFSVNQAINESTNLYTATDSFQSQSSYLTNTLWRNV